jgi:hypothetical protein
VNASDGLAREKMLLGFGLLLGRAHKEEKGGLGHCWVARAARGEIREAGQAN